MAAPSLSATLTSAPSTSSTLASLVAKPTSSSSSSSGPGAENGECKLLGPFALFIQGALGLLALLSLVFKRWRERPQRPVKIWAFDASKQVIGSGLLHVANLFMSIVSSGELKPKAGDFQANPCSFYLLNLAIDTTIGIPILIGFLHLITHAFALTPFGNPPESIQSGNYGQPPRTRWWLKQCLIYFLGLLCMKFCVYLLFTICPWIIAVGNWALQWTEGDERIQVFFVMLFFPLVMNALQYYIIDSFIKEKDPNSHGPASDPTHGPDGSDSEEARRGSGDSYQGLLSGDDEIDAIKDNTRLHVVEDTTDPAASTGSNSASSGASPRNSGNYRARGTSTV